MSIANSAQAEHWNTRPVSWRESEAQGTHYGPFGRKVRIVRFNTLDMVA